MLRVVEIMDGDDRPHAERCNYVQFAEQRAFTFMPMRIQKHQAWIIGPNGQKQPKPFCGIRSDKTHVAVSERFQPAFRIALSGGFHVDSDDDRNQICQCFGRIAVPGSGFNNGLDVMRLDQTREFLESFNVAEKCLLVDHAFTNLETSSSPSPLAFSMFAYRSRLMRLASNGFVGFAEGIGYPVFGSIGTMLSAM